MSNPVSDEMDQLVQNCKQRFSDATVLLDTDPNQPYNTVVISLEGPDKDEVSKRAMAIAEEVRNDPVFAANNGRVSVERMTNDEQDPDFEYYDVLAMIDEDWQEE